MESNLDRVEFLSGCGLSGFFEIPRIPKTGDDALLSIILEKKIDSVAALIQYGENSHMEDRAKIRSRRDPNQGGR